MLATNGRNGGGGFSYRFWFETKEDLDEFMTGLKTFVNPHVVDGLEIGYDHGHQA